MSVWSDCLLGDIANFRNGRSSPERTDSGALPVFGSNGVIGFSEEINADPGTSIIGRVGSYCGSVYYSETACWVTDNAIAGEPKEEKADGRFLYYLLKRLDLNRTAQGSGQPLLNQSILNSIKLTVPSDVGEQQSIAEVLSSLDEKIELNRKQNRTLEAIAQALFKRWFVEFEFPDEYGRPYQSSGGAMQPSELGEIPVGWEVGTLGDVIEPRNERITPSQETRDMPYVPIDCISPASLFLQESKSGEEAQSSLIRFYDGDILFGGRIQLVSATQHVGVEGKLR